MKRKIVCLLSAFAALVFFSAVAISGDAAKDQKALEGVWAGKGDGPETFTFTIKGNTWELKESKKEKEFFFKGTFTLDVKAKPHTIDMKVEEGGKEIDKYKGKTALGIYELSGDTLKWCANEPGEKDRPKEFSDKGKSLFVEFKRVK